jgi:hypothetical protein
MPRRENQSRFSFSAGLVVDGGEDAHGQAEGGDSGEIGECDHNLIFAQERTNLYMCLTHCAYTSKCAGA